MHLNQLIKTFMAKNAFLGWILFVSLVPLIIITFLITTASEASLENQIKSNLTMIANNKADIIENFIVVSKKNAAHLASNPLIIQTALNFLNSSSSEKTPELNNDLKPYLTRFLEQSSYVNVFILSPQGKVVFSVNPPEILGRHYGMFPHKNTEVGKVFDNARTLLETAISDFETTPSHIHPQLYIASPIFDKGRVLGVLVLQMDNVLIEKVINNTEGLGETGETLVGTIKNNKIYPSTSPRHTTISNFIKNSHKVSPEMYKGFEKATLGEESSGTFTDYRDKKTLGAWQYLPAIRWGMVVKVDQEEALKPILALKQKILILGGITLLLALGLSYMVANRLQRAENQLKRLMSELEVTRNEALEASRAKSSFLANMSHELRTPLNAIIGYSEMLKEDATDQHLEGMGNDLEKINTAARHLLSLINDILDISKIEAGKMEIYWEKINLAVVLEDIRSLINPLVSQKNNQFKLIYPANLGEIHTDITKLRQSLLNLISNAGKFTEQGTIILTVSRFVKDKKEWIKLIVGDTGIGMTPLQLEKIFAAFIQADASTTRRYGGTGLGLYLTQRFIKMLGGEITVVSEINKGSTFTIIIPAVLEHTALMVQDTSDMLLGKKGFLPTVLLIDDDLQFHTFLTEALSHSFRFIHAYNGEEGILMAKQHQPDAIVLDVIMPAVDGWAVLSALRADSQLYAVPVIMATILADKEMGYALGVRDYLTKPINPKILLQLLYKHVGEKPLRILVVEDDVTTRTLIARILKRSGMDVVEAENGEQAFKLIKKAIPSLILLDLMMPIMDGFELIEHLRHDKKLSHIPIVVITAKDLTVEEQQQLNGAVKNILKKGAYKREQLLNVIRSQIEHSVQINHNYVQGVIPHPPQELIDKVTSEESVYPVQSQVRKSILIIDDDKSLHSVLEQPLLQNGYQVFHAYNGEMGIELAKKHHPDVITLDVVMPNIDGWGVLAQLRSQPDLWSIPIVLMSKVSVEEFGYMRGVVDFLLKPIQIKQFLEKISKFVGNNKDATILIVEDDVNIRVLYRRMFKNRGWQILEMENGKKAIEYLEHSFLLPNLILLDLMMPEVDGFEVLEKLQINSKWSAIPVIVITAKDLTKSDLDRLKKNSIKIFEKAHYTKSELLKEINSLFLKIFS